MKVLLLGVMLALAFLSLYAFSNLTVAGQSLENSWARAYDVRSTAGYWLDEVQFVPPFHLDVLTVAVGTAAAVCVALVRRRWRAAALVAIATPGSLVIGAVFKLVAGRPELVASLDAGASYPSGHAGIALAVTAALLIVLPRRALRWVGPVLVGWCLLVAGGLQAEGQHRASEIVGSGLLVAATYCCVAAAISPVRLRVPVRTSWSPATQRSLAGLALLAALIGAVTPVWWQTAVYAVASLTAAALVTSVALRLRSNRDDSFVTRTAEERPLNAAGATDTWSLASRES